MIATRTKKEKLLIFEKKAIGKKNPDTLTLGKKSRACTPET